MSELLRRREVERRVGLSCSTLYRLMAEGRFPPPIRVAARSVRWPADAVEAYISERRAAGQAAG